MIDQSPGDTLVDRIKDALRTVIDPELGHNVVDLGLIYDVVADDRGAARVTMTTTTRGCPATRYLQDGVRESASDVPGVASLDVVLTYQPAWSPSMMSAEIKWLLGIADAPAGARVRS
jgi:metal-sulfur cluster biosynthetic enzyme